jgi:hypothetical protein
MSDNVTVPAKPPEEATVIVTGEAVDPSVNVTDGTLAVTVKSG